MNGANKNGHAVVIGGSMAGLLAARVLADHFERVTILERDRLPDGPSARKGTPQARHAHVLLVRGQRMLQKLFPGLIEEMVAAGAHLADAAQDVAWQTAEGWAHRFRSGVTMLSTSRDLLEWGVRRRVAAVANITFREAIDVTGLVTNRAGEVVTGAAIHSRETGVAETMDADLVVDASGRGSRAPDWLRAIGHAAPKETLVDAGLGYASRVYRVPESFHGEWKVLYIQASPLTGGRSGLIQSVEGGRWVVTLSSRGGQKAPTDEAGFLEFTRKLPSPPVFEALRDAEPLSPISGFRATANRLRHYERLSRMPDRFVVLGDAACAFNPVYGQGMTTAALGAEVLGECLNGPREGMSRRFQRRLAEENANPWRLATAEDYRYVAGYKEGWFAGLMRRYVDRVVRLGTIDAGARLAFLKVLHLIDRPTALFSPMLMIKALMQKKAAPASRCCAPSRELAAA